MSRTRGFLLRALERTGLAKAWRFLHRRHVTILMLHGVMGEDAATSWTPLRPRLTPGELERHLESLRRAGYHFVPLADAVDMLAGRRTIEPYTVAVTFDDGYRNNATRALPVMRRLGVPLTLFLPTGKIERRSLFAFDRLDFALQRIAAEEIPVAVGPVRLTLKARPRRAFAQGFSDLREAIKATMPEPHLESCEEITTLLRTCETRAGTTLEAEKESCEWSALLEWAEVERLAREPGVDIQSHTVDHVRLAHADADTVRRELQASKRELEARTGRPCVHLAYPDGAYDGRVAALARELGYTCAVTTRIGLNARGCDLMELSRIALPIDAPEEELLAHVSGLFEGMARLRAGIARLFLVEDEVTMALTTQIIEDWQAIEALAPEWNALLVKSRADSIFLTWEWIDAWRSALGQEIVHPFVVVVRDAQGALVGLAPLHVTSMRLGGIVPYRTLQTLGDRWSAAEYPDWIAEEARESEIVAEIARALSETQDSWSCIWMPVASGWTGARERIQRAAAAAGFTVRERAVEFSAVALPTDFETYLKSLSQNARSVLRRRRKQILAEGTGVTFEVCEREEDRPAFLEALFALNRKRWNAEGLEGTFIRKPLEAEFYRRFTPKALEKGWLRIFALRRGAEFLASQIGYAYGDSFLQLQEGFDPTGPDGLGNALRGMAIERLIGEGIRTYDFLGEFGDHKRRWLAEPRIGYDLLVGRNTLKAKLLLSAQIWPTGRYLKPEALAAG